MMPLLEKERTLDSKEPANQNLFLIACHLGEIPLYLQIVNGGMLNLQREYGNTRNTLLEMALYETAFGEHTIIMENLILAFNANVDTIIHNEPRMINPRKGEPGISNPLIGCIVDVGCLKSLELLMEYGADLSKKYCEREFRRTGIFELALERFFKQHRENGADEDSVEFKIAHAIEKQGVRTELLPSLFSVTVSTEYLSVEINRTCHARVTEHNWSHKKPLKPKCNGQCIYLSDELMELHNMPKIIAWNPPQHSNT
ncbi:MAG: hypothetical protein WC501_02245 [Candidatus Micrarchaeia archaeon]